MNAKFFAVIALAIALTLAPFIGGGIEAQSERPVPIGPSAEVFEILDDAPPFDSKKPQRSAAILDDAPPF